jgi:uncharacterized protein (DUF1810 family)
MAGLGRFRMAQDERHSGHDAAPLEIRAGRKRGQSIWYVFPQLAGLGVSPTHGLTPFAMSRRREIISAIPCCARG